jgi:hypothetical protein
MHPSQITLGNNETMRVRDGIILATPARSRWCIRRKVVRIGKRQPNPGLNATIKSGTTIRLAEVRNAKKLQDKAARHIAAHKHHAVLTGGPGTGKTWLYDELARKLRGSQDVIVCAPTATAAAHLPQCTFGGRTFDSVTVSRVLMPSFWKADKADRYDQQRRRLPRRSTQSSKPRTTTVFVDEVSMVPAWQLDRLYEILLNRKLPFRIVLGGDHNQLPPPGGLNPWASEFVAELMRTNAPVYTLCYNWRFARCPRMQAFNTALRARDFQAAFELLSAAAMQHPKVADENHRARYVAYTHRQLATVNKAEHGRLVKAGAEVVTFVGGDGSRITLCDGELVAIRENVYDRGAQQYTQRNGQTGAAIIKTSAIVSVTQSTKLSIRLENGDLLLVSPKELLNSDAAEPGSKRGKKGRALWTFVGMVAPCTGFTAHAAQGATMADGDTLTVDMHGMPSFELCLVALTRHPLFRQLRVVNVDVAAFQRLFSLCPCGHDQGKPTANRPSTACSQARIDQRQAWIDYTETHVVHVPPAVKEEDVDDVDRFVFVSSASHLHRAPP